MVGLLGFGHFFQEPRWVDGGPDDGGFAVQADGVEIELDLDLGEGMVVRDLPESLAQIEPLLGQG